MFLRSIMPALRRHRPFPDPSGPPTNHCLAIARANGARAREIREFTLAGAARI